MKLVAFGDSFVEGFIKSINGEQSRQSRLDISFPNKIVEYSEIFTTCENFGFRGAGNECIAYDVYKYITTKQTENCFFLIVWSGPYRSDDYQSQYDRYAPTEHPMPDRHWQFCTEQFVCGTHKLCELHNIKFAMINSFSPMDIVLTSRLNWIKGNQKCNTVYDIIAQRYCADVDVDEQFIHTHTHAQDVDHLYIADCFHPTIEGHKLIANTLLPILEQRLTSTSSCV